MNTERSLNESAKSSAKLLERLMSFIGGDVDDVDTVEEAIAESIMALMELCKIFDEETIGEYIHQKLKTSDKESENKLLSKIIAEITKGSDLQRTYKDLIFRYVCDLNGITVTDLLNNNNSRKEEYRLARQLIMYVYREFKPIKKAQGIIGGWFDKDHATVYHAHKTMNEIKENKSDREVLKKIRRVDNYVSNILV